MESGEAAGNADDKGAGVCKHPYICVERTRSAACKDGLEYARILATDTQEIVKTSERVELLKRDTYRSAEVVETISSTVMGSDVMILNRSRSMATRTAVLRRGLSAKVMTPENLSLLKDAMLEDTLATCRCAATTSVLLVLPSDESLT